MQIAAQKHTGFQCSGLPQETMLSELISSFAPSWNSQWCWANYKPLIEALAQSLNLTRLCEIGGGRSPLFTLEEIREMGVRLTVNDISQNELDRGPGGYETLCLDIAGDIRSAAPNQFDRMFSQMVFEHVRDSKRAWQNIYTLLAPGGVALAFFPTLYAFPFLLNRITPDAVTGPILRGSSPIEATMVCSRNSPPTMITASEMAAN